MRTCVKFTSDFFNNHYRPCVPVFEVSASPSHTSPRPILVVLKSLISRPQVPSPHARVPMHAFPCPRPTFIHSRMFVKSAVRRNPLGNWVILVFSGQKPCTRIISSTLLSFLHFFEGYKCSKLSNNSKKKVLMGFLNSCKTWNLFSQAPLRNCLWCYYR